MHPMVVLYFFWIHEKTTHYQDNLFVSISLSIFEVSCILLVQKMSREERQDAKREIQTSVKSVFRDYMRLSVADYHHPYDFSIWRFSWGIFFPIVTFRMIYN